MAVATTDPVVVNGLDTTALGGLVEVLKESPEGGRVTFRTGTRWQEGARTFTTVRGFAVDGAVQHEDERSFVLLSDEPRELSGTDAAPGPVEQLMHAVASCIAATANANAAFMGVELSRLDVELEGTLDLHGIFALDEDVRPGLSELTARIRVDGDADATTLETIARRGFGYSPVRDTVEAGVRITPEVVVG